MPDDNEILALSDEERAEQDSSTAEVDILTAAEIGGLAIVSDSQDPQPLEVDTEPLEERAFTKTLLGPLEMRHFTTVDAPKIALGLVALHAKVRASAYRGMDSRALVASSIPWEGMLSAVFENQAFADIAKEHGYSFNTLNQYLGDFSRYLRKHYGGREGVAMALWEQLGLEADVASDVPKALPDGPVEQASPGPQHIFMDPGAEMFVRNNRNKKRRVVGRAALIDRFTPRDPSSVFERPAPEFGAEELEEVDAVEIFTRVLELNEAGSKALAEFLSTNFVPTAGRRPLYEVRATIEALRQHLVDTVGSLDSPVLGLQRLQKSAMEKTLGWYTQSDRTVFRTPESVYEYSMIRGLSEIDRLDAATTAYKQIALVLEAKLAGANA